MSKKYGFIGAGNMAIALIKGMISSGLASPEISSLANGHLKRGKMSLKN